MPISGTVTEFNAELESSPEIVNEDPYEKGWMIKITIADDTDLDELLTANGYKELIGG